MKTYEYNQVLTAHIIAECATEESEHGMDWFRLIRETGTSYDVRYFTINTLAPFINSLWEVSHPNGGPNFDWEYIPRVMRILAGDGWRGIDPEHFPTVTAFFEDHKDKLRKPLI